MKIKLLLYDNRKFDKCAEQFCFKHLYLLDVNKLSIGIISAWNKI